MPTAPTKAHEPIGLGNTLQSFPAIEASPLRRPHYFDGKLLRADASQLEQAHLRRLAMVSGQAGGWGVACGLDAQLIGAEELRLGEGLAIDSSGRVLVLPSAVELDLGELIARSRGVDQTNESSSVAGSARFEPCAPNSVPEEPPVHVPSPVDLYLITIGWLEETRGDDEVHAGSCDDRCTTGVAWRYLAEGVLVRAIPLDVGELAASTAFLLETMHLRSRVASSYFAGEAGAIKSLISAPGLGAVPWCAGATLTSDAEVPLAVIALSGGAPLFLDTWIARRERIDAPPRRYWAARMAMRSWSAFLAQVLQFQCQLHEILGSASSSGDGPNPAGRALLAKLIDEMPNLGSFQALDCHLQAAIQQISMAHGGRVLLRGGIVELPSAGYLPVTPEAATRADRLVTPTVNEQVRTLLGEGLDLRFCVTTPDAVAHALEESQHMDRISLLYGLDHPDQKPAVDILVPHGIRSDQEVGIRAGLDWVLFRRRRVVQDICSIAPQADTASAPAPPAPAPAPPAPPVPAPAPPAPVPAPAPAPPEKGPVSFALAVLERALSDLKAGVKESAPNDGPRIREYLATYGLHAPNDWCAAALGTWIREAEKVTSLKAPIAGSPGAKVTMAQFKTAGIWRPKDTLTPATIRPGMIPVWHRGDPTSWKGHIGIIEEVGPTLAFRTIEANSGPGGDRVARMDRSLNDMLLLGMGELPGSEILGPPAPGDSVLDLPSRLPGSSTGTEFIEATKHQSRPDREESIFAEVTRGNVPSFLRTLVDVTLSRVDSDGFTHTCVIKVTPDYLAIGTDEDFIRIPMNPLTAQRIADSCGCLLPTREIVDVLHARAVLKLKPQTMVADPKMISNEYYLTHHQQIENQRAGRARGHLTAGHKKDVVISVRLQQSPDKVAIYGWHWLSGEPIQPLSVLHENTYADYSHGIRLVCATMILDGVDTKVADVLRDPVLCALLSDEGPLESARIPSPPGGDEDAASWEDYAPGSGKPTAGQALPSGVIASILSARAAIPPEPGLTETGDKGGHIYIGVSDSSHMAYLTQTLDTKAATASISDQFKIRAFKALLRREGTTAAINTYDNQIVTWGVGWAGLGQLGDVMAKAVKNTPFKKMLHDCGLSPVGKTTYRVVDLVAGKVVSEKISALHVVRGSVDLLYLLIHAARAPATRDAVTNAQLETFMASSASIPGSEAIYTQALFNFVVHLKHWAPAYVSGVMAWALPKVTGERSAQRDKQLAPLFGRFFYGKANSHVWKPDWGQFKGYWGHMKTDGLDCSDDLFITQTEAPDEVPEGV